MAETCRTREDKEKNLPGFGWKPCMKGIPLHN